MPHTGVSFRFATKGDVEAFLKLLPEITSRPESLAGRTPGLNESTSIFYRLLKDRNIHLVVGELDGELVATLTIVIIPI